MNNEEISEVVHADWSYQSNIYEVNLRQYTPEGTFKAFSKHLPRLREMGIDILWLMPITPISPVDRQGTLGSYYAVQDYVSTNPDYGTMDDFKDLVKQSHSLGFKLIIDFVGNHTGNGHPWIKDHPEYYVYNPDGSILHPHGWKDVAQLNFNERKVWDALIDAMLFWVRECNIDGFRCDMAHLVPLDLWVEARKKITALKQDIFMLGECEVPSYHQAFDATYTWKWMHATEDFYHGKMNLFQLLMVLYSSNVEFPRNAFRAYFTSNHDENSWNGTEFEKYGSAALLLAVLSCTWNGLPLIYSGQELPNLKRLKFFDKDPIEWNGEFKLQNFYKTLLSLRKRNPALMAGNSGSTTTIISPQNETNVFSFLRKKGNDEVLVVLNCSNYTFDFKVQGVTGKFKNIFSGSDFQFTDDNFVHMDHWGYLVFEKQNE